MMVCLCDKADVLGSGPIPEKSQTIQSIIACTNIKCLNSGTSPPCLLPKCLLPAESLLRKAQQIKSVHLLINSETTVSH